ncbi:DUF2189 domain-containing protein [Rhizobium halophytocola]|uniref:Membrane protein n=1 Tax=Rhizobium halophytocola TaxID=735519 RepID=A0ABS4DZC8_9HYPH|nr:DUF2189 domain-containing protein [Rhizobium halophytocola]MBP1851042.1 putative membrane protein [Rhizobium halophytocola]
MTAFHVWAAPGEEFARPVVNKISNADVIDALRKGAEDFYAKPSHYVFLGLIYPVAGILLMAWAAGANLLPLLFPLASGFALIGPFAALGLYEMSRRREAGLQTSWQDIAALRDSPALPSLLALGAMLVGIELLWLLVAQGLYIHFFDGDVPLRFDWFLADIFNTGSGLSLMIWGIAIGFIFAVVVLASTIIAFPMLLEQDCGAGRAIETSLRVTARNPVQVALWGIVVSVMLVIGFLPMLVGLTITVPILGHATWHLYTRLVTPAAG